MSRDVYMIIGYEDENGKKVIQNLVPSKYKLPFGDVKPSLNQGEDIFLLIKMQKVFAQNIMEIAVETVLP